MKRDEALDIVAMLSAHWPGAHWSVASMEAYTNGIQNWDADATMKAVTRAVQTCEFYPKVSVLREFYRMEKRLAEPDSHIQKALADLPSRLMPAWCKGWAISRYRYNDFRVWTEQDPNGDWNPSDLIPDECRDKYIAEGSDLSIEDLFRPMIGNV